MNRSRSFALVALVLAVAIGCDNEGVVLEPGFTPFFPEPFPPVVDDFATSQRELGRLLFFEKDLSGNRTMACASCHVVFLQATEPVAISIGHGGNGVGPTRAETAESVRLSRNTPDLFFRSDPRVTSLFWDGRLERLPGGGFRSPIPIPFGVSTLAEIQALMPLVEPTEMLGSVDDVGNDVAILAETSEFLAWDRYMSRLIQNPAYAELFRRAFPELSGGALPDITHVARAIVVFERALWERFDSLDDFGLFEDGSSLAFQVDTTLALEGRSLFHGDAGCARCHSGELFSDQSFHDIGVPQFGPGREVSAGLDLGRFEVTGAASDRFAFRTPMLRNCALTGPYMHNGAFESLEEAVRHHLAAEASLRSYTGDSLPPELAATLVDDPATLDLIAQNLADTAPSRPMSDHEVLAIVEYLKSLTSATEFDLTPESGVPLAVPSGIEVDLWPGGAAPSRVVNFGF